MEYWGRGASYFTTPSLHCSIQQDTEIVGDGGVCPIIDGVFADDEGLRPIVGVALMFEGLDKLQEAILQSENQCVDLLEGRKFDLPVPGVGNET